MPFHRRARERTIAAFLETSRIHFNLNPPSFNTRWQRQFSSVRANANAIMLTGTLAALFGGPAIADSAVAWMLAPESPTKLITAEQVQTIMSGTDPKSKGSEIQARFRTGQTLVRPR